MAAKTIPGQGSRRRSLFELIMAHAEAGTAMHIVAGDVKRLASMPTIEGRAKRHRRVLDDTPAPDGENPTDWVEALLEEDDLLSEISLMRDELDPSVNASPDYQRPATR